MQAEIEMSTTNKTASVTPPARPAVSTRIFSRDAVKNIKTKRENNYNRIAWELGVDVGEILFRSAMQTSDVLIQMNCHTTKNNNNKN